MDGGIVIEKRIENITISNKSSYEAIIALAVIGSYHEECFIPGKSDIDIIVLTERELEYEQEFEIEDQLNDILIDYFEYNDIHYTFLSGFVYSFSEQMVLSKDKLILKENQWMEYLLGYSCFKRDCENLDLIRIQNLKELEELQNGIL